MDLFQTLILSFVEGVTEFLPVSSTGHLVLTSQILNIPQTEFVKSFEIIIQLGAILSVVFLFAPSKSAPRIVAPARETPGITEIDWKRPIRTAFFKVICSIFAVSPALLFLCQYSTKIKAIPPKNRAITVIRLFPIRVSLISL